MSVDPKSRRCPCGTGEILANCCAPILAGRPAPTAERLMRSRFTAFALGDAVYLRRSWHPSTRPAALDLDEDIQWRVLEITQKEQGGPFDREGTVTFAAHWRDAAGNRGVLEERSRFVKEGADWFYLDGAVRS